MRLREIMMQKDLENVTCKEVRQTCMGWNLHFGFANTDSSLVSRYLNSRHHAIFSFILPGVCADCHSFKIEISVQRKVDLRSDLCSAVDLSLNQETEVATVMVLP